jgi:uncharacterized membrane protein SirB2
VVDDLRIADIEYFLGLFDVVGHVASQMAAGGVATVAAVVMSLVLGFAVFGGTHMRAVNPLWAYFALASAAFFAWVALHVLAAPVGFGALLTVELVGLAVLPALGLIALRKNIARRETAHAYFSAVSAARTGSKHPTTTA